MSWCTNNGDGPHYPITPPGRPVGEQRADGTCPGSFGADDGRVSEDRGSSFSGDKRNSGSPSPGVTASTL